MNSGEKEVHYFSWDENFRKAPLVYQQRFDGSGDRLGVCSDEGKTRGEVRAAHLDHPSPSPSPPPPPLPPHPSPSPSPSPTLTLTLTLTLALALPLTR